MSKKKLLITMGCSYTEGVGCWDMDITPPNLEAGKGKFEHYLNHPTNLNRFHEQGWPNRVGKKLGFDKVINIGKKGGSTSGQVKKFVDTISYKDFSEYETYIIFQLPNPDRFSFYKDESIWDVVPTENHSLSKEYIMNIHKDIDVLLEQRFYVSMLYEMCMNRNIKLSCFRIGKRYHNIDLKVFRKEYIPFYLVGNLDNKEIISPICNHFNEIGYEIISNMIKDEMNKKYSELANVNEVDTIEWQYIE